MRASSEFVVGVLGVVLLLGLPVGALGQESAETRAGAASRQDAARSLSRGAELFSRYCQRCHNPRGAGERSDREWAIIMQHMETRANITTSRAKLIRGFLVASNAAARAPGRERSGIARDTARPPITGATVEAGRKIFRGEGACFSCHGEDLDGGPVAPSLTDERWRNGTGTYGDILEVVRNGVDGTAMSAYPAGISDEMARKVSAYVWAVTQGRAEP
jgi:mono/diheme cytochrome c family protein